MVFHNNNYQFIEQEASDMEVELKSDNDFIWLYSQMLVHWLGGTESTRRLYFSWLIARHGFTDAKAYEIMQRGESDFYTELDGQELVG